MCGFIGVRYTDNKISSEENDHLKTALSAIRHRGPDANGIFQTSWLSLAHARLAIIDLTSAAQQPMHDDSGRYVIVFNGEIYNYQELAKLYLTDDNKINRCSDTSVLLAMYKRFGRKCLYYLDGMFAFVVVDLQERTLFFARDRFGEKPLYFLQLPGLVAFASEITALQSLLPDYSWEIDPVSLAIYHIVGSIPAPRTIYKNIHALRPANWLEFDLDGGIREGNYWSLEQAISKHNTNPIESYEDAIKECRHHLLQAVQSRMVSDVPVGIFLSGGLDSGSILSLLHAQGFSSMSALCIDFQEERFSEYRLAEASARAFGAKLHRRVITAESFIKHLDRFFAGSDQPTTDGFNTYFVSMHAKEMGIKVWLSGVAGDELFGGYPSFHRIGRLQRIIRLLQLLLPNTLAGTWARHFPNSLKLSRCIHMCINGDPVKRAYQLLRNPMAKSNAINVLAPGLEMCKDLTSILDGCYPSTNYCRDYFQRASAMETSVYMASQLLRDIDNFSMAHSIEARAPFLDHNLFGFVFSLPNRFKVRKGAKKNLLTSALSHPLPDIVLGQPKRGFTFPIETWLKEHMVSSFRDHVLNDRNKDYWDLVALENMWKAHQNGKLHWSILWGYYAFARWMETRH